PDALEAPAVGVGRGLRAVRGQRVLSRSSPTGGTSPVIPSSSGSVAAACCSCSSCSSIRAGWQNGAVGRAACVNTVHAGGMASGPPVVIYPPDEDGGRRVRIDGEILGRAFSTRDVAAFMQEAGLQEFDEMDV